MLLLQTWQKYEIEHELRFQKFKEKRPKATPVLHDSAYVFDTMWTAALALNRTEARLKEMDLSLKNFSYDDPYNISDIIYEEALNVTFFGLTVSVCRVDANHTIHIYTAIKVVS